MLSANFFSKGRNHTFKKETTEGWVDGGDGGGGGGGGGEGGK